ncbi:MAG: radical SAM protein [Deltaproteobacteria bacterium]|nr:radical SAM protein [Deltaproteobacteria bacterium]
MRVLLITPPMVQFNTAYPAVPMLAAFLRQHGHEVAQEDLSLGLALRLFSPAGVDAVLSALRRKYASRRRPASVRHLLNHGAAVRAGIAEAVAFLQGRAPASAARLAAPADLPEGPRFAAMRGLCDGQAQEVVARHRASLFLDEIADGVRDGLDARFALARYAERLAADAASYAPLARDLARNPTLVDRWIDDLADTALRKHRPTVVGFTVPFPGALFGALRIARRIKTNRPSVVTVLGGGYVNTELRALDEPRLFDCFDYVTYDDGEIPLLRIVERHAGAQPAPALVRTRVRREGKVLFHDDATAPVLRHRERPAPDLRPVGRAGYVAMAESPNPMHRLWSERPWLKLQLAHGCYWHRCAFCDTSLDYIRRYDPADAATVVAWMERARADTGLCGFHFVDEAAPPALLGNLARLLIERDLTVEWWANIRLEKQFTPALARLLRRSGCLAVTAGLECAHDRLLGLMDKGITTGQAAEVTRALAEAGLLVHAYLMYGYPTQTAQEIIDGLDFVRRLFARGHLHSAYWHRFALTLHAPAFRARRKLRLRILDDRQAVFARNEVPFVELGRRDPGRYGAGLRRAIYNFMHGVGLEADVRTWFDFPVPRPRPGV